jgi:hypothetical protein
VWLCASCTWSKYLKLCFTSFLTFT